MRTVVQGTIKFRADLDPGYFFTGTC